MTSSPQYSPITRPHLQQGGIKGGGEGATNGVGWGDVQGGKENARGIHWAELQYGGSGSQSVGRLGYADCTQHR